MSTKQQVDKKNTKQVRIDSAWHKILKVEAAQQGVTIKALLDEILSECPTLTSEPKSQD